MSKIPTGPMLVGMQKGVFMNEEDAVNFAGDIEVLDTILGKDNVFHEKLIAISQTLLSSVSTESHNVTVILDFTHKVITT